MLTTVVIPVKALEIAKSRLSCVLNSEQRRRLSEEMLLHVLRASRSPAIGEQVIITGDRQVMQLAIAQGAVPVMEEGCGLNQALSQITTHLTRQGAPSILILPADLPFITARDLEAVLNLAQGEKAVVISPCHRGHGTNLLLIKPPGVLEYAFGDQSFELHCTLARRSGANLQVYRSRSVEFDLDLPEDYHYYLKYKDPP